MHKPLRATLFLAPACALILMGCGGPSAGRIAREVKGVDVVDQSNLTDLMLTTGNPADAVDYFTKALADHPERLDLKRGLAKSLIRANRAPEGAALWAEIAAAPGATNDDRVSYAESRVRLNDWDGAAAILNTIPPTVETFDRYRLEAMVADSRSDWKKADSFYEIASGMTPQPASVFNNWGFSKLTRKDYAGAEHLFLQALTYDPSLFTAKNNLVLARGAQGKYDMPVIQMSQDERAQLLYTLALTAIKQGDVAVGKGLLQDAIDTAPQYFEAATRSLKALEGSK